MYIVECSFNPVTIMYQQGSNSVSNSASTALKRRVAELSCFLCRRVTVFEIKRIEHTPRPPEITTEHCTCLFSQHLTDKGTSNLKKRKKEVANLNLTN